MTSKLRNLAISSPIALMLAFAISAGAQTYNPADHTDPINLIPLVRDSILES